MGHPEIDDLIFCLFQFELQWNSLSLNPDYHLVQSIDIKDYILAVLFQVSWSKHNGNLEHVLLDPLSCSFFVLHGYYLHGKHYLSRWNLHIQVIALHVQ